MAWGEVAVSVAVTIRTNLGMNVEMVRSLKQFTLRVGVIEEEAILDSEKPTTWQLQAAKCYFSSSIVVIIKPHCTMHAQSIN